LAKAEQALPPVLEAAPQMNGLAPPVVGAIYKRRRIRIKEVVANDGTGYANQTITVAGNKDRAELSNGSTCVFWIWR